MNLRYARTKRNSLRPSLSLAYAAVHDIDINIVVEFKRFGIPLARDNLWYSIYRAGISNFDCVRAVIRYRLCNGEVGQISKACWLPDINFDGRYD